MGKLFLRVFNHFASKGLTNWIPDKLYLKLMYKFRIGKKLDLRNPKGFNEKLQWLKLYDRKDKYSLLVDKYEVKKIVGNIIGEEYIIPTLGVWDSVDEIDYNILPDKFVLKCTHDSGSVVICTEKASFNITMAEEKLKKGMGKSLFYWGREWPYKNVPRRIIAEEYLNDSCGSDQLTDYKIYTFNGIAKFMMINKDRNHETKADYFDRNFEWLDFTWGYPHSEKKPQKPENFDLMIELAEKLANGLTEVRVDFYESNHKVYFGELTFFDGSGFEAIEPVEWDLRLGSFFKLPNIMKG